VQEQEQVYDYNGHEITLVKKGRTRLVRFDGLSLKPNELLILYYLSSGLKYVDIAQMIGLHQGTLKNRISEASRRNENVRATKMITIANEFGLLENPHLIFGFGKMLEDM
jgi:DNA-directed RNA polymerase specialized sigma24 family protein